MTFCFGSYYDAGGLLPRGRERPGSHGLKAEAGKHHFYPRISNGKGYHMNVWAVA